jgi:hypothetical protein
MLLASHLYTTSFYQEKKTKCFRFENKSLQGGYQDKERNEHELTPSLLFQHSLLPTFVINCTEET